MPLTEKRIVEIMENDRGEQIGTWVWMMNQEGHPQTEKVVRAAYRALVREYRKEEEDTELVLELETMLANVTNMKALPVLVEMLNDEEESIREIAGYGVEGIGPEKAAIALLKKIAREDKPEAISRIVRALEKIGEGRAFGNLRTISLNQDKNPKNRALKAELRRNQKIKEGLYIFRKKLHDDLEARDHMGEKEGGRERFFGHLRSLIYGINSHAGIAFLSRVVEERWKMADEAISELGEIGSEEARAVLAETMRKPIGDEKDLDIFCDCCRFFPDDVVIRQVNRKLREWTGNPGAITDEKMLDKIGNTMEGLLESRGHKSAERRISNWKKQMAMRRAEDGEMLEPRIRPPAGGNKGKEKRMLRRY